MKIRIIFCLLAVSFLAPGILCHQLRVYFPPVRVTDLLFEARLGKLQIVLYQMVKAAKVQKITGSAWLRVLGMVPAGPEHGPDHPRFLLRVS